MSRVKKAFKSAFKSIGYLVTGKYNGSNGNDTIVAIGFGGTIDAKAGNDTITVGGFKTTVNTGSGNDKVYGGSAHLKVNDTTGNLSVNGAAGYAEINKSHSGDIDFNGASGKTKITHHSNGRVRLRTAAFSNVVRHYGSTGDIDFAGVGARNDFFNRTSSGKIHFRGAGASNKMRLESTGHGTIDFGGAGAHNDIHAYGEAADIKFVGAGFANKVKNTAKRGNLTFTGAGASNVVERSGESGRLHFTGAGASNRVSAHFTHDNRINELKFTGAGLGNSVTLTGKRGKLEFVGAGASNTVRHKADYGDLSFTGAGASNRVERIGRHGTLSFVGAGLGNVVTASFSDDRSFNRLTFRGVGVGNVVTLSGARGHLDFGGGGGANIVTHTARHGNLDFVGIGAANILKRTGTTGDVDFTGAGYGNVITHHVGEGNLRFVGAGAANVIDYKVKKGALSFDGAGAANVIKVNFAEYHAANKVTFNGAGLGNVITLTGEGKRAETYMASERYLTMDGFTTIRFFGRSFRVPKMVTRTRQVERTRWVSATVGGGDIVFRGAGAANVITHSGKHGDVDFKGVGIGNVITLSGSTGDVRFEGGGGANVITSTVDQGDIDFTGVGAANVVTRLGVSGNVTMNALGYGNVLTVGLSGAEGNSIRFNGGGGANIITLFGTSGATRKVWVEEYYAETVTVQKEINGELHDVQETRQKSRMVEREVSAGPNTGAADIHFNGAGLYNVITHAAARGDVRFNGAGGANVITLTGEEGDIIFNGAGAANILTHTADHGNIDFKGAGLGNILTRVGKTGNIWFKGAGGANILTSTVDHGHIELIGIGSANILTRTGRTGTARLIGAGAANILTVNTTEHGKATLYGAGLGNVITATGGATDIEMRGAGGANIVTNASRTGKTDVIAAGYGNIVTHTSDGDMRAWVAGRGNIITNTGNGHSDVIAVGQANIVTLMDGGSDVKVLGQYNIVTAGKGYDRVLALGQYNLILTRGTETRERDEIVALGRMSIVDAGEGMKFLTGFASNPLDALKNISGLSDEAVSDTPAQDEPNTPVEAAPVAADTPNLLSVAMARQADYGIGADDGLEDVSEEDIAAARSSAMAGASSDGSDVLASAKSSVSAGMAAAEEAEQAAAAAEAEANGEEAASSDAEAQLSAQVTASASADPADADTSNTNLASGALPDGIQEEPSTSFVWSVLGAGFQWKRGDGVVQVVVGVLNVTFGSDGSDILIAGGKYNVVFGGKGDDVIIAGNPFSLARTAKTFINEVKSDNLATSWDRIKGALALTPENKKAAKQGAKSFSGAAAIGGEGNDTIILASDANFALTGTGNDTVIGLGKANVVVKEGWGNLNVGLAGLGNVVVHTGHGTSDTRRSRLTGLMLGRFNIAYAHKGVDVHGLVMMGEGNLVVSTGGGNVYAGMLGRGNVIVATGNGNDIVVQAGVWKGSLTNDASLSNMAFTLFTRVGDGNSAFGQYGDLNVAVKVGDGHVTGVAAGGQSVLVNVGDGTMSYIGLALEKNRGSWAVKVGDGDVNGLLISNPFEKGGRDVMANALGKGLSEADIASGKNKNILDSLGSILGTNALVQVGDGSFTGLAAGSQNVMVRVGSSDTSAPDAISNSDRVSNDLAELDAAGRIGNTVPNLEVNPQFLTNYDTKMFAAAFKGGNIMVDANPDAFKATGEGVNFAKDRERATSLLAHLRSQPGGDPNKAKLSLREFMTMQADGSHLATTNTIMGAINIPLPKAPGGAAAPAGQGPVDPDKPRGVYAEHDATGVTLANQLKADEVFHGRRNGQSTAERRGGTGGKNALVKLGNGDFIGVAVGLDTLGHAIQKNIETVTVARKVAKHEAGEVDKFITAQYGNGRLFQSNLDELTKRKIAEDYEHEMTIAREADYAKAMESGTSAVAELHANKDHQRNIIKNGASHTLYDQVRTEVKADMERDARKAIKAAKKGVPSQSQSALDALKSAGGNIITHVGHGNATMVAAGEFNLIVKVGLGSDQMIALGDKNIIIQMADPVTTQSLVETGNDVQVAIGTGNLIANMSGTSDDVMVALNPNGVLAIMKMMGALEPSRTTFDRTTYEAPKPKTFAEKHFPILLQSKKNLSDLKSFITNGGKGDKIKEKVSNSWGKFTKEARESFTLDAVKSVAKQLPFVSQAMAIGDGVQYMLNNISTANFIVGGRGSDVIVAFGSFNVVFGDNVADVLEFDVRSLVGAKMQSFSGLPFGLSNLVPFMKADLEVKTLNGDIGDLLGGLTPGVDGLPNIDPEGAGRTAAETWGNFASSSLFTNVYMPPIGSMITGTIAEITSGFAAIATRPDFVEFGDIKSPFANEDAELYGGGLTKVASQFEFISLIDFDDLLEKKNFREFLSDFKDNFPGLNYLNGDGDLMVMLGENNVGFGGFGNDIAVAVANMNLLTMGDGNDLAVVLGSDNRVTGDDGADILVAIGEQNLITGDNGNDIIIAAGSYNRVRGEEGEDIVVALGTKNLLFGGNGVDLMIGLGDRNLFYSGDGEDFIIAGGVQNVFNTGGGTDIIVNVGIASITQAGSGADYIQLGGSGNAAFGEVGNDTFITDIDTSHTMASGGSGDDRMETGGASNLFLGDEGNDTFVITDKLRGGNTASDARFGQFEPNDPIKPALLETDVIQIADAVTEGDPADVTALLNDVWFVRDGNDLRIETRATVDRSGLRLAGDITFDGYFAPDQRGALSGPPVEVMGANGVIGVLSAQDLDVVTGLGLTRTGDIHTGFLDGSSLNPAQADALAGIDLSHSVLTLTEQTSATRFSDGLADTVVIGGQGDNILSLSGLNATEDTIRIDGAAVQGAQADPTTIGDLLRDIGFVRSGDDLTIRSQAATGSGPQAGKVAGDVTLSDYFKLDGQSFLGADLELANDAGQVTDRFTAAKLHSLINEIAALPAPDMANTDTLTQDRFTSPLGASFAARPIAEFT
ncbi:hypothetical protein FHS89_003156 [Rubricella aquisinus]|uniref:Uncharacterized protein n=1 Tax=Rubricella aquisinus TaxID=2028108 RepID=A0A840X165_9RHOB|nr:hypothetical protein [Rubricella aquisinus]MBB5517110.1 hypothetical protein [Rubricella aquisinus]